MAQIPFSKKILYRILALSFPFLLFLIAEICTRIFFPYEPALPKSLDGWGIGKRPAAGYISPPLLKKEKDMIVSSTEVLPFMPPISFSEKPIKKRIFCFGGSATLGVPFENTPEKTFPHQLQQILLRAGEDTEVINLGGASFGSDHVLAFGLEALEFEPSYLLIYSGNNEFFTHIINWELENRDWRNIPTPKSHLIANIQKKLFEPTTVDQIYQKQESRWTELLQNTLNKAEYVDETKHVRSDPIQQMVIARYIRNLTLLYNKAQEKNIPILFAVVPSNIRTPPAISIHSPSIQNAAKWTLALKKIDTHHQDCGILLQKYTAENPWNAEGWYKRAQCAENRNETSEQWFQAARDLDMLPGRPNQALTDALLNSELPLVLFETQPNFFHDSCHLTEQGYKALAEQFAQLILTKWKFVPPTE